MINPIQSNNVSELQHDHIDQCTTLGDLMSVQKWESVMVVSSMVDCMAIFILFNNKIDNQILFLIAGLAHPMVKRL
jgi:hypothetical protein